MASNLAKHTLATSKFPSRPINEADGIRLIDLLPASSAEDEVQCELVHTTLANCTDIYEHYTALSYVWGNPSNSKRVWVDQSPVLVTYNLYSALRDIRHENRTLQVWADAICINQQDDEEKLKQISMMGRIYSLAYHTVIYLELSNPEDAAKLDGWVSSNFEGSQFNTEIADLVLSHTWFRRVWVFQELVFSRDPRVQVGRHRFSWNALYCAGNLHVEGDSADIGLLNVVQGSKLLLKMHQAREEHHMQEKARMEGLSTGAMLNLIEEGVGLKMISLLRARRGLGVKFPKDMIFAHIGFASDGLELMERINYSMTWVQVYNACARYMIDKGLHWQLFDDLGDRDISTDLNGLSSWAPDWSITSSGLRLQNYDWCSHVFNGNRTIGDFLSDGKRASNTNMVRHAFIYEPPVLACLGAKLGVVARVGDGVSNSISRLIKPYHEEVRETLLSCWLWVIKPYTDEHSTLWRDHNKNQFYDAIHGLEPDLFICRLFKDIWESLGDKTEFGAEKFSLEYVLSFDLALSSIAHRFDTQRRSSYIVALIANGSFAFVPKWTNCGDLIAGLILPSNTTTRNLMSPLLVLRPLVFKDGDLEASLTAKLRQRIRPILHCKLLGQCEIKRLRLVNEDPSTPEYEKDTGSVLYDTLWERVMAGSAAMHTGWLFDFDIWPFPYTNSTKSTITWHTFAVH